MARRCGHRRGIRPASALQAGAADVIANAGAAPLDGVRQHLDDGVAQRFRLLRLDGLADDRRMQPGLEERFVGVNIADAGDVGLIEQDGLEIALRCVKRIQPIIRTEIERLRAEAHIEKMLVHMTERGKERHTAEATDIAKAQFVGVVEREDDMRMVPRAAC